jgi:hypothetical protein
MRGHCRGRCKGHSVLRSWYCHCSEQYHRHVAILRFEVTYSLMRFGCQVSSESPITSLKLPVVKAHFLSCFFTFYRKSAPELARGFGLARPPWDQKPQGLWRSKVKAEKALFVSSDRESSAIIINSGKPRAALTPCKTLRWMFRVCCLNG